MYWKKKKNTVFNSVLLDTDENTGSITSEQEGDKKRSRYDRESEQVPPPPAVIDTETINQTNQPPQGMHKIFLYSYQKPLNKLLGIFL